MTHYPFAAALTAAVLAAPMAQAAPVAADFTATLTFGANPTSIARYQSLNQDIAGAVDLGLDDAIRNDGLPGGFLVDLNAGGLLTITAGPGDYFFSSFDVDVTNIQFDTTQGIAAVTSISNTFDSPWQATTSFGSDRVSIGFNTNDFAFSVSENQSASFQLNTTAAAAVPLPAGVVLLLGGLGGLTLASRKRKRAAQV